MRGALLLVAMFGPVTAWADIVDIKWTAGEFAHKTAIAPSKFLEVCGKLNRSDSVAWNFSGNAAADFNIHYHVGKEVSYPENRKAVASGDGVLSVALDQDYCWMWTNRSAQPIEIALNLKRAGNGN